MNKHKFNNYISICRGSARTFGARTWNFAPSSLNSHLTWNQGEQSFWILCFGGGYLERECLGKPRLSIEAAGTICQPYFPPQQLVQLVVGQ